MIEVFVVICIPPKKNLQRYVYGVFYSYDAAYNHFTKYGDKDSSCLITKSSYYPQH